MKVTRLVFISLGMIMLNACVSPIGKEDFTCPNIKKGGICGGPRDVMKLTNNRASVHEGQENHEHDEGVTESDYSIPKTSDDKHHAIYKARSTLQSGTQAEYAQEIYTKSDGINQSRDSYDQWPSQGEPLAPEPLAVVEQPRMIRILVNRWKDRDGHLHLPGYIFKDITPQTIKFGRQASMRPTRVIPFDLRKRTNENLQQAKHRGRGVDGLGVISPLNQGR